MLDTGISAAFAGWNAGSLGVNTLEEVGKIGATKAMLMAGGESVTEQLANLAAGFSHKFDLKEVIVSMLSAGANAEIPSDSQIFHTALTSLGSNVATQEWETHHLDVESLAATVLGTTLGQAATNTIEKGAAEFASELKAYVEAQFAAMTNGNGQNNVMPAQGGIQGDSVTPAKAGVQKTNQDVSNSDAAQSSADTPSNRYAKLQKQSQDADPASDPGADPDANNPSTNSNNSNANNSSASGNQSKADRWNQQAKQNGSYGSKQSSQEPAYYEKQDAQWYINQGRLAAYSGQMPDWLKNLSQTDLANFYSGYREGGIESVTASVESSLLPIGEGIFGALKFGLGFFRDVRALIPTAESAQNIMKGVQLKQYYENLQSISHLIEKNILNLDKTLTPEAIKNAFRIMDEAELRNSALKTELSKIEAEIGSWGKYVTRPSIVDPAGRKLEIHFYQNAATGNVYYGMDYKIIINSGMDTINLESEEYNFINLQNRF